MIQISTTAPASWPGASTPLIGPARPVAAVTPVAPVGSVTAAGSDEEPARSRRRGPGDPVTDGSTPATSAAADRNGSGIAATVAEVQAKAEQQKAEQEAREAREQADREAIERLRQALVDAWDASAAVVEQALGEKDVAGPQGASRAASLYDEASLNPAAGQTGQIISRRV
ncbi:hypothetical protein [Hydrogenophaga sp. IBVHS2]|uniref:hypothetical protein n=1 Tax=Hydrogenophaga sp. IBVHS2 TaxID=1985170 RepID=UPI000A2D9C3E|nr:hypothetical protein [Hydrogenophaga sp. IBVHS2]OSZ67238.1 hypothetical protein CAP38_00145 [Hydrogenophaga sp. IBVHS2]